MELNKLIKILVAIILSMIIIFNLIGFFVGVYSYHSTMQEVDRIMQKDSLN